MAKPFSGVESQDQADKTVAVLRRIRDAGLPELETFRDVAAALAKHAYRMEQQDICFEVQAMLLGDPSPIPNKP